jgi:hypothetical protein
MTDLPLWLDHFGPAQPSALWPYARCNISPMATLQHNTMHYIRIAVTLVSVKQRGQQYAPCKSCMNGVQFCCSRSNPARVKATNTLP